MTLRRKSTLASTSGSFAPRERNVPEVTISSNLQRLQHEAGVTDPGDPSFNSDLDSTVPALPVTYREIIAIGGIDPNDEDELDQLRDVYVSIQTVPPRPYEDLRAEMLSVLESR